MDVGKGICYIVGARPLEPELIPRLEGGDLLIAADKGYATLRQMGITPDLVVGDFDSLGGVPDGPAVIRLPQIKDETDMGFALNYALDLGHTRFVLLGGLGGRLDHTIANIQLLACLNNHKARGILAGDGQAATVITNDSMSFSDAMCGFCSVFALSNTARGVTLEGLKYPLEDETLTNRFPLGVSNEFLGLPARVAVEEGTLLLIWETRGQLLDLLPTFLSQENRL